MAHTIKVGFIGIGLMGLPMATNILKKGFDVTVYNRTPTKAQALIEKGATLATSPQELAEKVDVILTMVTAADDVKHILFDENGVVKRTSKQTLTVIDMSTIGPTAAREIGEKLATHSIDFLDAPVTGSTPKAISGELTIFIGGEKKTFEALRELFLAMGTNLQYMGDVGSGQAIKLINNHLIAVSIVSLAEGMLLADAMGLSREKVADVLKTVPATSDFMHLKMPNYVKNEFPLLFSTANMKKDLSLAVGEAKKSGHEFPTLTHVHALYEKALNENLSEEDMSAVIKLLEKK